MGQTRHQTAAVAGAFDAQTVVERLEAEMAEMCTDLSDLKQSTAVLTNIQKNMVTLTDLDTLMQKYLKPPASPTGTSQIMPTEGNSITHDPPSSKTALDTSSFFER
jgi:hypothetical protein